MQLRIVIISALLCGGLIFAQATKQPTTPATPAATEAKTTANTPPVFLSEMDQLRQIVDRPVATYQDLADLVAMYQGVYEGAKTPAERRKKVAELGIYDFKQVIDPEVRPVARGAAAKAMLNTFKLSKGFWFQLTGWERYAMDDIQRMDLMSREYSERSYISGAQLVSVMEEAEQTQQVIAKWPPRDKTVADAMAEAEEPAKEETKGEQKPGEKKP